MTREQIQKAAEDFAEREYEISDIDKDPLRKGFYHGALWRIDFVWHDNREKPEYMKDLLICLSSAEHPGFHVGRFENRPKDGDTWNIYAHLAPAESHEIECWAYIDDLQPGRKVGKE